MQAEPNTPPIFGARPPAIVFNHVGLRYGRAAETLSDVNFALDHGSINFVTGPSGAGKTSLLKLMYLQMRPSRGLISLFGQDTALLEPDPLTQLKRRMGIVLQDFVFIDHLSVLENVALPLRISGLKRQSYIQDVISLLQWVGLGDRMHALPETLSGGEAQRTAIARAIVAKPDILIADEPTGSVDPEIGTRLIHLLMELNRQGTTLVIATHARSLIPDHANILSIRNANLTYTHAGQ